MACAIQCMPCVTMCAARILVTISLVVVSAVTVTTATNAPEHVCVGPNGELDCAMSGESLLQRRSERVTLSKQNTSKTRGSSPQHLVHRPQQNFSKTRGSSPQRLVHRPQQNSSKRELFPEYLVELGVQTFGSEASLYKVVEESTEMQITYAGVPLTLRILAGDNAAERLGAQTEDGQEYGLDTLLDLASQHHQEKITMIDMGGNYGAVSIAVFKKFDGQLRAVVTEPISSTFFFLRWNLWLNEVPDLSEEAFVGLDAPVGVVALNRGVTGSAEESLSMCSNKGWSMNARATQPTDTAPCDCDVNTCTSVAGVTTGGMLEQFFAKEDVTLLKMDCEGCEIHGLPALAQYPTKIKRLVGELHEPEEHLIDIACGYDAGQYMTKVCRVGEAEWSCCLPLDCFPERNLCKW